MKEQFKKFMHKWSTQTSSLSKKEWLYYLLFVTIILQMIVKIIVLAGPGSIFLTIPIALIISIMLWSNSRNIINWANEKWYGKLDKNGNRIKNIPNKVKKKTKDVVSL